MLSKETNDFLDKVGKGLTLLLPALLVMGVVGAMLGRYEVATAMFMGYLSIVTSLILGALVQIMQEGKKKKDEQVLNDLIKDVIVSVAQSKKNMYGARKEEGGEREKV